MTPPTPALPPYLTPDAVRDDARRALAEDVGMGDLTAALVPANTPALARVISREAATVCGRPWFDAVFALLDADIEIEWAVREGEAVAPEQTLCTLRGNAAALLSGERAALNFLQTLSGVATLARRYSDAVAGTGVDILDTRKTLPGLRKAQKYAVLCGGCRNHRLGLYDAVLIKENHIAAAGSIRQAVEAALGVAQGRTVEVEVETLAELREALAAGADIVLLDNMDRDTLREAVAINTGHARRAKLELSGGVTLDTVADYARTGVDYISVGALTKHVQAVDLSMRFST